MTVGGLAAKNPGSVTIKGRAPGASHLMLLGGTPPLVPVKGGRFSVKLTLEVHQRDWVEVQAYDAVGCSLGKVTVSIKSLSVVPDAGMGSASES